MPEEEDVELQDSPTPEGDDSTPEQAADETPEEKAVDWESRAKQAENHIRALKEKTGAKSVKELEQRLAGKPEPKKESSFDPEDLRAEIRLEHQGYHPDDLSIARKLRPDVSIIEAVKDPQVKAAIQGLQQSRKVDDAIPDSSGGATLYQGKSFKDMTKEEKSKSYSKVFNASIDKARKAGRGSI